MEPSRAAAPQRAPIELLCDERTAPRLARAAVRRGLLRRAAGPFLLCTAAVLAAVGAFIFGPPIGIGLASALLVAQVLWAYRTAVRSFRRMAPAGQVLASRYDGDGRLALTTAIGTSALARGSVDRVEHPPGMVHIRMLPGRCWALLPAALLTEEDLAFLRGDAPPSPSAPSPSGGDTAGTAAFTAPGTQVHGSDALPLMHVLTPQSQRALQAAVTGYVVRGRSGRFLLACVLFTVAVTALVHDPVTFTLLGLVATMFIISIAGPAVGVRRRQPVGHLIRAAVTPTHLVLEERESRSTVPWSSIDSCTTSRGAVVLILKQGVALPLPRPLFADQDLARLQRSVLQAQIAASS